jgi:hypothetical protein
MTFRVLGLTAWVLVLAVGDFSRAQNASELSATYGRGVHAYFANQLDLAEQLFSQVIEVGSTDPRVYYFRAMTRIHCGRKYEAELDMRMGAAFEARDPGNRQAVGKALQRVQGPHRLELEQYRLQARLDRLEERQLQTRQRYEQLRRREQDVLRRETPVPLEDLLEPSLAQPGEPSGQPILTPPQSAEEPALEKTEPAQPVPPAGPVDEVPFGGGTTSEDDIFGAPSGATSENGAPKEPVDSKGPSDDDPFSEPEPPQEPAAPVEEDDPFAATPSRAAPERQSPDVSEAAASGGDVQLAESDRIESGQLFGVLGRVAASVLPWRGMEAPTAGLGDGPEGFLSDVETAVAEVGPADEESATVPASAEEPLEPETESTDLFGDSTDDPSGGSVNDNQPAATPEQGEDHQEQGAREAPVDDPFGEF